MPPSTRSALAPKLNTLLQQALNPDDVDARMRAIDDIRHGLKVLNSNREGYAEADAMYDGEIGMVWASLRVQQILTRQEGIEDIEDFNYAAIPVDRITARLQISSVVAAPADENEGAAKTGEDATAKTANKAIAKLRKDNELDAEEKRAHEEVSKYGEEYLLVWPGEDDDGNPVVDMRVNSPHDVVMIYDEEDPLKPSYVLKSWERHTGEEGSENADRKRVVRANLYYADRIERWATQAGGNPDKEDDWFKLVDGVEEDLEDVDDEEDLAELVADEFTDPDEIADGTATLELGDIPNPWGRVPWFHLRNHRPHGHPEHLRAYGPQRLINKIVFALAGAIDYMSFPQRYLLMDPALDDPMANLANPDHPDLDDDDVENDGGNAGLDAAAGSVWKLWGKMVGEFTVASPQGFIDVLNRAVRAMAELTGLPLEAFSRDSADQPSGESRREANGDFLGIIQDRQDRYDATWQDAYEFALKILGITSVSVDIRWAPAQRVNDLTGWQVVQAKINAGVPPKVALEEAGYAPEHVDEWLKDATGADIGRRVALLGQIATATQAFGAAIATGAISAGQTQAIIEGLLGMTIAGTDPQIVLPQANDLVDPQAALKAQQAMQDKQLEHAGSTQDKQLTHATETQQGAQAHAQTMAEAAHARAQEMFGQQVAAQADQQGRGPGGRRPVKSAAKAAAKKAAPRKATPAKAASKATGRGSR